MTQVTNLRRGIKYAIIQRTGNGQYELCFKWDNGIEVKEFFNSELAAKQYYGQHIQSPMTYPRAKWK